MSMRGAGMNAHMAMRSLTRDSSVKDSKLKKGTLPRIWAVSYTHLTLPTILRV